MRGTLEPFWFHGPRPRFIPAYAGNAYGAILQNISAVRFIPAYAGNALDDGSPGNENRRVHPRVCGERISKVATYDGSNGSSPRMRGTLHVTQATIGSIRFIPAYAGNASPNRKQGQGSAVHPRVCGERSAEGSGKEIADGSSPRMRGTPQERRKRILRARFIPAYAGNATEPLFQREGSSVHPRVCGERLQNVSAVLLHAGSSPRMRGTRQRREGKPQRPAVHPRVCGERFNLQLACGSVDGSSPRMRGTRLEAPAVARRSRFIPAYAGNAT